MLGLTPPASLWMLMEDRDGFMFQDKPQNHHFITGRAVLLHHHGGRGLMLTLKLASAWFPPQNNTL